MAERDLPSRLRRAVKENNLFLVKRLIQRTGMRNPDPDNKRYTSLAWAAVSGHEETFEFLLTAGHDDDELSKDSENNTILHLLADVKGHSVTSPYRSTPSDRDLLGATLRMAKLYFDRYGQDILDWSNSQGKTALHVAALKGHEELVRMLCDFGADYDLTDNEGNTPLHYASAWGHIPIVQILIERGCAYVAKNNEGFSASDYAYSFSTKETLQNTARVQYEQHKENKKARRNVFAQAAARGGEWRRDSPSPPPHPKQRSQHRDVAQHSLRTRSGSGASRSTATSDSGELPVPLRHHPSYSSLSTTSSPSQSSAQPSVTSLLSRHHTPQPLAASSNSTMHSPAPSQTSSLPPPPSVRSTHPALSPVASRMRERDADAMEKYMSARGRQRSGSADTMSTDPKSLNGSLAYSSANEDVNFVSAGPSANGDDITALANLNLTGSVAPRRRLRPSASALQLGANIHPPTALGLGATGHRSRSGTSPADLALQANGIVRPTPAPPPVSVPSHTPTSSATLTPPAERALLNSPSPTQTPSPRPLMVRATSSGRERENFTGPPAEYAKFPDPPVETPRSSQERATPPQVKTPTQASSRRLGFKLSKSGGGSMDGGANGHRRGGSATSAVAPVATVRGLL